MVNWKPIPGYEGRYEVSDDGRVRSLLAGTRARSSTGELRLSLSGRYLKVTVTDADGVSKYWYLHQLVALAFIGPKPPGTEVRHGYGGTLDNRASNLSYGTSSQNNLDKVQHGTHNMARKTHCKRGHPFNEENTAMVTLTTGTKARSCRKCAVIRQLAYQKRKKEVA